MRLPWNRFDACLESIVEIEEWKQGETGQSKVAADLRRMLSRGGRRVFK